LILIEYMKTRLLGAIMTEFCDYSKKLLRVMGCTESIIQQLESGDICNIRCNEDYLEIVKDILDTENIKYTIESSGKPEKFIVVLERDVAKDYF